MEARVAGKYRLTRKIGSGAFGEIFHGILTFGLISLSNKPQNK